MCGRFTLRTPASVIAAQFALLEVSPFAPRFNIAPSQPAPVIRLRPGRLAQRELVWLRWGLIPSWADDPRIGNRTINARAETAAERPAFRAAFRQRRCLIVADGFYEWQSSGSRKQPYYIHLEQQQPFAIAGLWETWEGPDHAAIESCTLLTTEPNSLVRPIHDRMPAIVAPDEYTAWLDPTQQRPEQLLPLLQPYPSEAMTAYQVSPRVNSPAIDDPQCIEPVAR